MMKKKVMIGTLAGVIGAATILHPVEAASSKDQINKLKKEKASLQKEVSTLKKQNAALYSSHKSLKSKYSKLEKTYQATLKENKLLKDKVKNLSQGYQLLETTKQLIWNGNVVNKTYKSTPSLLLLKNIPYIPLDLATSLNNLPLKSTTKSFDLGVPKEGISLSALKYEKSTFDKVLYNKTMMVKGQTSVSNIIFDSTEMESATLYYLNERFTTFETDVLVTPTSVAKELDLYGNNGIGTFFKIVDTKTNKVLAEYELNYDEDPVHIKLNVSKMNGIKLMVDSIDSIKSITLSNPVLSQ